MSRPFRIYDGFSEDKGCFQHFSERHLDISSLVITGGEIRLSGGWPDTKALEYREHPRHEILWIGLESIEMSDCHRWPRNKENEPIPPRHLSIPAKCCWVTENLINYFDDSGLLFLQMALEVFDDYRSARLRRDIDHAIRHANEFRHLYRQLRFSEKEIVQYLENPDWEDPDLL